MQACANFINPPIAQSLHTFQVMTIHLCILVAQHCPNTFPLWALMECSTMAGCASLQDPATKSRVRQTCSRTGYNSHLMACNPSSRTLSTAVISVKAPDHALS